MKLVFKVLFSNRKQIILSIIGFVIILTSLLLLVNIRQCVGTTIETNIKNNINNRDIYIDLGLQGDEKVFKEIPSSNKIEKFDISLTRRVIII